MLSVVAVVCVDSAFIEALNTAGREGKLIP